MRRSDVFRSRAGRSLVESPEARREPTCPSGTRLIWGRAFPAPGASTWDFAVPVEGGFASLVIIEGSECPSEKVQHLFECFSRISAPASQVSAVTLDGTVWEMARAGAESLAGARIRRTYVVLLASDHPFW